MIPSGEDQIRSIAQQLRRVVDSAHNLSEIAMNQSLEEIENNCGVNEAGAIAFQSGAELLHEASHALNDALVGVRDVLSCRTFNPIYTTFVHDGKSIEILNFE